MKHFIIAGLVMLVTAMPVPALAGVIGGTNEEVRGIAGPILDNILEAFEQNDYAQYSRDFDNFLKESISEKKFGEMGLRLEGSLGKYQSREYLGFMMNGQMTVVLWKGRYELSEDDVLIKLIVSKRGDKNLVTGLWFQ